MKITAPFPVFCTGICLAIGAVICTAFAPDAPVRQAGLLPDGTILGREADPGILEFEAGLLPDGTIPVWQVRGPFGQPHEGFGTPKDFDPVGEASVEPAWDENWFPQAVNSDGFLDFNDIIGWVVRTDEPEKIWMARAAYATAAIISDTGGEATLYIGGNSRIKVLLNGNEIFQSAVDENAVKDANAVGITLKQGENRLTVRTTQSHQNYNIVVFDELRYDWGFYARIDAGSQQLHLDLPEPEGVEVPGLSVRSTIFYKNMDGILQQRHDVYVRNNVYAPAQANQAGRAMPATLEVITGGESYHFDLDELPFGVSRHEIWLPEIQSAGKIEGGGAGGNGWVAQITGDNRTDEAGMAGGTSESGRFGEEKNTAETSEVGRAKIDGTVVDTDEAGRSGEAGKVVTPVETGQSADLILRAGDRTVRTTGLLKTGLKYELHLMFLSHTDIGYTHTQPVVREIHLKILDDVIDLCEADPEFKWTIETVWMLEVYYRGRTEKQFRRLTGLIDEGRIAVSPFYSNPFTGMVSEEEMIRSLDRARYFADRYGISFVAAVYNDVPGQTWFVPQLLKNQNISFFVNGLNEVYSEYRLQKAIPKVMQWQGDDGSRVVHYRTESYNEAMAYGLERDNHAAAHRMWQRIAKLEAQGYPFDIILLNSAFGDNLGISMRQWEAHKTWNSEYAWPRFVPATIAGFAGLIGVRLAGRDPVELPVLKGDAISDWDVYYQGEPHRMQRYRQSQHRLFAAENMAVITALQNPRLSTLRGSIDRAYDMQLHYSGHGSGLEYGYGSDSENERAFDYREAYVSEASVAAMKTLERSSYRATNQDAALDGEFAVVINPHAFAVTTTVELGLKPVWGEYFEVEDAATGACMPSVVTDHVLKFTARDLPALGWKKYRLVASCAQPRDGSPARVQPSGLSSALSSGTDFIENAEYRIRANTDTGTIMSVFDKRTRTELLRDATGFAIPALQTGGPAEPFEPVGTGRARVEIVDESPVAVHMRLLDDEALYPLIQLSLYDGKPGIDVTVQLDLTLFEPTSSPEAYAISFPRMRDEQHFEVETVGGFITGKNDRLPGMSAGAFSIRRVLSSGNMSHTLHIASPDARVVFLSDEAVHFNLANNFPDAWNRREPNDRVLTTRFSVMFDDQPFHSGDAARFGWVSAAGPAVVRGWFRHEPAEYGDVAFDSEYTVMQALRPLGDSIDEGILIRLRNTNKHRFDTVSIEAPWIAGGSVNRTDFTGSKKIQSSPANGGIEIRLKPNETVTLKWKPKQ